MDGAHLLAVLANHLLLISIFVKKFGYSDVRAEEILVDGVSVILNGLWLNWRVILSASMLLEVAVLDVRVAHAAAVRRSCSTSTFLPICTCCCQHRLRVQRVIISQERFARIAPILSLPECRDSHVLCNLGGVFAEALFKSFHKVHEVLHGVLLVTDLLLVA